MRTDVLVSGVEKIGKAYELLVEAMNQIESALDDVMEGVMESDEHKKRGP
jgi:hypothetical protein